MGKPWENHHHVWENMEELAMIMVIQHIYGKKYGKPSSWPIFVT